MTRELDGIFRELGLTQYLDAFVDQGFDSWETILDIQESDLDALGVKLGHRRKLQRRIANARGFALGVSIASPVKSSADDSKQDGSRHEPVRSEVGHEANGIVKRKYRRHPKPDENAPERPPSAYVLFSNKMREDLKSQNLTFTEIAKLVGENWQSLPPAEKEAFESQANAAKEKYHRDLLEYKKTPEYRKYAQYLHDFKEKQAKQNQAHEASKRAKMEPPRLRHGSTSSSSNTTPNHSVSSGSGSGSEGIQGSDFSTRRSRVNSASTLPTPVSQRNSMDEPMSGTRGSFFEHDRRGGDQGRQSLPPLSAMLENGKVRMGAASSSEGNPYASGFVAANHRRPVPDGPTALPGGRAPVLRHEPSSTGSIASSHSAASLSRPSAEGSLPIHALLSGRSIAAPSQAVYSSSPPGSSNGLASPLDPAKPQLPHTYGPRGYGFQSPSSAFQNMRVEQSGDGDVVMTSVDDSTNGADASKQALDGMNALLRAGEIVGRRN